MVAITKLYTQKVEPILDSEPWEPCFRFFCLLKKHQNTYYSLPSLKLAEKPLKIGNLKRKLVPTNRFFRCYVGLREANYFLLLPLYIYIYILCVCRQVVSVASSAVAIDWELQTKASTGRQKVKGQLTQWESYCCKGYLPLQGIQGLVRGYQPPVVSQQSLIKILLSHVSGGLLFEEGGS